MTSVTESRALPRHLADEFVVSLQIEYWNTRDAAHQAEECMNKELFHARLVQDTCNDSRERMLLKSALILIIISRTEKRIGLVMVDHAKSKSSVSPVCAVKSQMTLLEQMFDARRLEMLVLKKYLSLIKHQGVARLAGAQRACIINLRLERDVLRALPKAIQQTASPRTHFKEDFYSAPSSTLSTRLAVQLDYESPTTSLGSCTLSEPHPLALFQLILYDTSSHETMFTAHTTRHTCKLRVQSNIHSNLQ